MNDPTNLAERIAALEARISDLQLGDLPLAALQRKLENDWQPDANVLLQPNSVTVDALASGQKIATGSAALSFTASADSALLTVTHDLAAVPKLVVIQNTFVFGVRSVVGFVETASTWTDKTFRLFARSDSAFTGTSTHTWLAIA